MNQKVVTTMINSPTYGYFIFDAVFSTDHSSNVTVTSHPVQTGASISDHAYMEPEEITLDIGMTDAAVGVESNHSVNAYTRLRAIMELREPVTVITRLGAYANMLITSISVSDSYATMNALRASVYLQQINVVSVATVSVQQTVSGSKSAVYDTGVSASPEPSIPETSASAPSTSTPSASSSKSSSSAKATSSAKTASKQTTTKSTTKPKQSTLKKLAGALGF